MKILIATGLYPPEVGGPATYSKILEDKLPKRGHKVFVLPFASVRHLPKVARHLAYFLKVLREGRTADVIYAQDPVSVGLPSMLAAKILRKKFILKVVGDYAWEQFQQKKGALFVTPEEFQTNKYDFATEVRRKIERTIAKNAKKIIVPSNYLKKIVMMWGAEEEKISVVYNAFTSKEVKESKEVLRARFKFNNPTILSSARLVPWKGFDMLIEMVNEISDITLIIAGDGPDRKRLELKVKNYNLQDRVKFLGQLPQDRLFEYIKAADVFVLNTGYEGLSHQLLEVMSIGTPIITTNIGGNPEVIENVKEGILVGYNKKDELKKAIHSMLEGDMRDTFVENAKKKLSLFGEEKVIENTINILKQ